MSHLSKIFNQVPVDVPNRSGFDLSFENLLTMKVGTLVPVVCEELLPNDTINLSYLSTVSLPPMATDFYGRVDLRLEAFFVPNRICWAGWERFITLPLSNPFSTSSADYGSARDTLLPSGCIECYYEGEFVSSDTLLGILGPGTLCDYLGFKYSEDSIASMLDSFTSSSYYFYLPNLLPFVAYHKIYDEWYRDPLLQRPLFGDASSEMSSSTSYSPIVGQLPYYTSNSNYNSAASTSHIVLYSVANYLGDSPSLTVSSGSSLELLSSSYTGLLFWDYSNLLQLRQRNFSKDYFTTAHLYPQSNDSVSGIEVSSSFTIPDLRSANVVQRWIERNNIAGTRYSDQIKATFGINPSDSLIDRPVFLGSSSFPLYNKSVYSTSDTSSDSSTNPFSSLGTSAGVTKGSGKDSLVSNFTSTEHGYLIVLASIVPHQYYSSGSRRYLYRLAPYDFANPLLQGLGEQPIYTFELSNYYLAQPNFSTSSRVSSYDFANVGDYATDITSSKYTGYLNNSAYSPLIFGYTQQFSEYKYHDDEVHGLLRDGSSLQYFALQSSFEDVPELSSSFIQIPVDYMDNVSAVTSDVSQFGAWCDFFFRFTKVSTLSEYVIPTLGDLSNTHKTSIPYNGTRL